MTAGAQIYGGLPTMEKGVKLMNEWLGQAGVDPSKVVLDTGSGLSYNTQLSAQQIIKVIRSASGYNDDVEADTARSFVASLAVAGRDGTLRRRFRGSPLRRKVVGKTGTLTKIIALSGILDVGGEQLCFAIVSNGHRHRNRGDVRKQHEELVTEMYRFLRKAELDEVVADLEDARDDQALVTAGSARVN